jgi:hypothetical protein
MTLDMLLVRTNLFMDWSVCLIFDIQCPRMKIEVLSLLWQKLTVVTTKTIDSDPFMAKISRFHHKTTDKDFFSSADTEAYLAYRNNLLMQMRQL